MRSPSYHLTVLIGGAEAWRPLMADDPIANRPIDDLTAAMSAWMTTAAYQLSDSQRRILDTALHEDGFDVRVIAQLRAGIVVLTAVPEPSRRETVLFQENVEPLRPETPFAPAGTKH